jgi:hypothetical protein
MEAEKSKMKVLYLERIFLLHHNMVEGITLVREHKRKRKREEEKECYTSFKIQFNFLDNYLKALELLLVLSLCLQNT